MPTADAHLHLFAEGLAGERGGPPVGTDELRVYEQLRSHHGIERGLVIGYEGEPRYAGNNDAILSLAMERPWVVPLVYVPSVQPPPAERLRELRSRGAAGITLYLPCAAEGQALSEWPAATLDELSAQQAIVSLNSRPTATARLADVVAKLEGCHVLFSHLGLPGRQRRVPLVREARARMEPLLALAEEENVMVKVSGLYAVSDPAHDFPHAAAQPFVDLLLEAFGPSRLLWGSDYSPALDFVSFDQAADTRLLSGCSPAEVADVMGANLLRLLG